MGKIYEETGLWKFINRWSFVGMAGLAVTYGLNLNARLSRWILSFCKLENKIISIERIYQYSQIPSEAPLLIEDSRPPSMWPENGTIELTDLKVRVCLGYYHAYECACLHFFCSMWYWNIFKCSKFNFNLIKS